MIEVNAIRNDEQLDKALARLEEIFSAQPGTPEEEELEILTTLIESYEAKHYPIAEPDPISAITFRMEQANLTTSDLVPMIGSLSKVREVLSGRRPITIEIARALHANLGIPAESLLARPQSPEAESLTDSDYRKFPIKAIVKAGWPQPPESGEAKEVIDNLIDRAGGPQQATALFRQGNTARLSEKVNPYALQAWIWQVAGTARENEPKGAYSPQEISLEFLVQVGQLSRFPAGPARASEILEEHGVKMVYTPALPKTYLDGAAFMSPDGYPVIGLTLRYDRVDNFWFTLMHELAHVSLHLQGEQNKPAYIDDLNLKNTAGNGPGVPKEKEADSLARNSLIPWNKWKQLQEQGQSTMQVVALAQELSISPAVVAGRVRYESRNYRLLSQLVGNKEVRKYLTKNR